MREKIAVALAAGLAFGTMFTAPAAVPVAVAAESNVTNRTSAAAYAEQGDKLFTEGKYVEAAEACEKAAELAQNNEEYWTSAGFCYFKAERWDKSAICYKNAIKINPNNGLANFYCGMAYYHQVEVPHQLSTRTIYERAAKFGDRAAELLPDDVSVRMAAGLIQESLAMYVGSGREKHLDKAYKNYCKAVDLDPNNASNVGTLSRFVQSWSRYGFQPYTSTPQAASNTDVTGAAGVVNEPVKDVVDVTGDIPYEILDSGAVKFTLRRGATKDEKQYAYYIFAKPEEFKAWPGAYAIGSIVSDFSPAEPNNDAMAVGSFFDYDPTTNTVQFYDENSSRVGVDYYADPENAFWGERMRVIDKNTVYIEVPDVLGPLVTEGPFKIAVGKMVGANWGKEFTVKYTVKYLSCEVPEYRDINGCAWSYTSGSDGKRCFITNDHALEAAIICCMLKGNLGEVPEGHDLEHGPWVDGRVKYHFPR